MEEELPATMRAAVNQKGRHEVLSVEKWRTYVFAFPHTLYLHTALISYDGTHMNSSCNLEIQDAREPLTIYSRFPLCSLAGPPVYMSAGDVATY